MCLQDQNDFFREEAKHFVEAQVKDGKEDMALDEWFIEEMSRDNPNERKHFENEAGGPTG